MIRTLVLTAIAALSVAAVAPVSAETYSVKVAYADLDLSGPAGRAVLERRITTAVRDVCSGARTSGPAGWAAERKCQSEARLSTIQQLALIESDRRQG